ncbi:MAG: globin family protein [Thalassolituus sp.]|jgi:hemoglobin-like flavoprotein|nr:globin family protein [Thalassolituus oleivorans]PHQ83759.1 MAG: hemin receptor [Thalassobium sp.]AHK15366.1 hemin receptor [Thalassolituus oleivorans R6-15]APR68760.1 hemin receptor [Thalassolituus oleivorans]MCA6127546.1 hemin receptor [Thalassolituus oleivorans 4BN06-13]PHQ88248.1 MAG: hemin receptor [Thalassobium sp.]|tara:strand:+ start:98 stop:556 length:459 start_codon:yes stop_codon:yes gene_type:complete
MSISEKQKQLVQASFKQVEPIADQAAEIFYQQLFDYDPSLRKLFKNDMKAQGRKLMAALKLAVASLDNLDKLVPILQQLAIGHVKYGVSVDDYTPVGNALLVTLKKGLGSAFTKEVRQAWIETYRVVATVMREAAYPNYNPDTYHNNKHYRR